MARKAAAQAPKKKRTAAQVCTALARSNQVIEALRQRQEAQEARESLAAAVADEHDPDINRIVPVEGC
ncbi:hypothetical protein CXF96_16660 [Stenotrophomonas sp. Betaine-02u-21]|uniref:hypothetical protein n=1 Tax=unclassified Stenotrophomonas TaxID=196198 RepID=UPI000C321EC0|nr:MULTISPECIES: hypothetical protein [unclassified Stenotrophomonas]PKH71818.1 hypothetical protein CXF96_16660 [Stenotrophomonas sp. Betaine-02u-21]PKH74940.1 hypothetical protein CXF90_03950 [Stenotrophomonas sp. Betaine-02u-23]PKH95888.1 hypothetical protein CXG43_11735 [Stenotrophomonas sp. Bg11-02]